MMYAGEAMVSAKPSGAHFDALLKSVDQVLSEAVFRSISIISLLVNSSPVWAISLDLI